MVIYLPEPTQEASVDALPVGILKEQFTAMINVLEHIADRRHGLHFHPCVQMWLPYPLHALHHARLLSDRIDKEGIKYGPDLNQAMTMLNEMLPEFAYADPKFSEGDVREPPHFMSDDRMRASHRSRLLTNHHEAMKDIGWNEPHHLSLHWPNPLSKHPSEFTHPAPPAQVRPKPVPKPEQEPKDHEL